MTITHLQDVLLLPPLLRFAAVNVLLIVSSYSAETDAALKVVEEASRLVECDYNVAYYSVELSAQRVDVVYDDVVFEGELQPWQVALLAQNITSQVPWFPCLRLVRNDGTFVTYMDSFQGAAIANHIEAECSSDRGTMLSRIGEWTRPVSKDRFAEEILRDDFRAWGVLVTVQEGVSGLGTWWEGVAKAIASRNEGGAKWVVSIVDAEKEQVGSIYGNDMLVLVDGREGRVKAVKIGHEDQVLKELIDFEQSEEQGGTLVQFREPMVWKQFIEETCLGDKTVWVLVYKTWCAFCQRMLPKWKHVKKEATGLNDVKFVETEEVEDLPKWMWKFVDGYPTVLKWNVRDNVETIQEWHAAIDLNMLEEPKT